MNKLKLAFKIIQTYSNWYDFFLDYAGLLSNRSHILYRLRNGMVYKTRQGTSDFAILNEITIFKEYFNPEFFELDEGSVVVDFGGQAGAFSTYVAYSYKCKILTFEPDRENFNLLKENIRLNKLNDYVKVFNLAVSNKSGKIKFFTSDHSNKGVHSSFYRGGNTETSVDAISLEDILRKTKIDQIDFLKMDIEGGEHELIKPQNENFFKKVKSMALEFHSQPHVTNKRPVTDLIQQLESWGFMCERLNGREDLGIIYAKRSG